MDMAEALLKVQEGLVNGRQWVWDEAARKLGTLLSSPSAFEGQHFLQVQLPLTYTSVTDCSLLAVPGSQFCMLPADWVASEQPFSSHCTY